MEENTEKKKDTQLENLIKKMNRFLDANKPADILIIKAHLLCEYYINQFLILKEKCPPTQIDILTFKQKIDQAFNGSKMDSEIIIYNYLKRLNKLRNKVGHELEYNLSEFDIDNLGYIGGKDYILSKYDFDSDEKRLHDTLTNIVIETAILFISAVKMEKNKIKNKSD